MKLKDSRERVRYVKCLYRGVVTTSWSKDKVYKLLKSRKTLQSLQNEKLKVRREERETKET